MVIALAALAAYTFLVAVQGDNKASRLGADELQVEHIAASGEAFVTAWLTLPRSQRALLWKEQGQEVFAQAVLRPSLDATPEVAGHFYVVQPLTIRELLTQGSPSAMTTSLRGNMSSGLNSLDASPWRLGVVNESGKLHLDMLLAWEKAWPGSGRGALLQLPNMTREIADAILDWIDDDDQPREYGAEAETYRQQARPYRPPNRVPDLLEELLLVRGVSPEFLLGEESPHQNINDLSEVTSHSVSSQRDSSISTIPTQHVRGADKGIVSNSVDSSNFVEGLAQPWSRFLTVHSAQRNETFSGEPRVYANNKDLTELYDELQQKVPLSVANFVVLYRQFGPVKSPSDGNEQSVSDSDGAYESADSVVVDLDDAPKHKLKSIVDLFDAVVRLPKRESADEDSSGDSKKDEPPRYVRSPITLASLSRPEIAAVVDTLTTHRRNRPIIGRLNLYDAALPVIAGLPMLEPGQAEQIVAARDTADPILARQGYGWLINSGVFTSKTFRAIAPYLTLGGDVVSFQVIGSHAQRPLYHRYAATVNGTLHPIRRVAFQDLRRPGYPNLFDSLPRPNETQGTRNLAGDSSAFASPAQRFAPTTTASR